MGFWNVAGKVAKVVGGVALDIAKELPSAMIKQAGREADRRLENDRDLSSEQRDKLRKISDNAKNR
jgi:hypothetical protein